jgi:peptidylprolyl isomerase
VSLARPEIDFPTGPPPSALQSRDLIVHYVGVRFSSGEQFDASWDRGEPLEFPLRGLIPGWQQGIPGMRVGGRRELVIPPDLAYGQTGSHDLAGETLIFVIDLLAAK